MGEPMRNNNSPDRTACTFPTRLYQPGHAEFRDPPAASQNLLALAAVFFLVCLPRASAEISTIVFSDDFSSNTIDPNKYQPDAPFFEGGTGDIHATAGGGVMHFVGTTSQQWWSGGTLRIVPTFTAGGSTPPTRPIASASAACGCS